MSPLPSAARARALLCTPLLALGLAACGSTVSTGSFKGEEHEVAQTIANLQADATANEQGKICTHDLSAEVVARLGGPEGCQQAVKSQLKEIDNLELSVQSIKIDTPGRTATAVAKSTYAGKKTLTPITLVKEGGSWKVSALG